MLTVRNSGSVPTNGGPITISDALPKGTKAIAVKAREFQSGPYAYEYLFGEGGTIESIPVLPCNLVTVSCVYDEGPLAPGDTVRMKVFVEVAPVTESPLINAASVSGGGAPTASTVAANPVGTAAQSVAEPFGFESFSDQVTGANGLTDAQAGDHPYETTVSFMSNTAYLRSAGGSLSTGSSTTGPVLHPAGGVRAGYAGSIKDFVVDLPPGFVGDPQATPKCPQIDVSVANESGSRARVRARSVSPPHTSRCANSPVWYAEITIRVSMGWRRFRSITWCRIRVTRRSSSSKSTGPS